MPTQRNNLIDMMNDVDEFQKKILELPCEPGILPPHRMNFKIAHVREEMEEILLAADSGDFEAVVDGFIDAIYVAMGALLEMGVRPIDAWEPVHAANMAKRRGTTKRGESYDAVKSADWTAPDHGPMIAALELRARVRPALLEATKIMLERGLKYNSDKVTRDEHFPFGHLSIFQMMWVKVMRMRADIESGRAPQRDHYIDLINYSGFGVDLLDGRKL